MCLKLEIIKIINLIIIIVINKLLKLKQDNNIEMNINHKNNNNISNLIHESNVSYIFENQNKEPYSSNLS